MRISNDEKEQRLQRIHVTLRRHPDGLSESDVADMLRLNRRTVYNYLHELFVKGVVYKDGHSWFALPADNHAIRPLDLSAEQALTLYLAVRLLVKQHSYRSEIAETALQKLAQVLVEDAGISDNIYEASLALSRKPDAPEYSRVFRTILQSYVYRRKVMITYHPLHGNPFETSFAPYLLEPSPIGFTTYVMGWSDVVNDLRTFKIERITDAQLTRDEYRIPADFPGLEILQSAWSIFHGTEVQQVQLRFSPRVARRVRETQWHDSQLLAADGSHLIMTLEVADTTDLKPWIRSWGADCEVLEPVELRNEMIGETRALMRLYRIEAKTDTVDHSRFDDMWGIENG
ncbi:MAG: WYL domain-containing transcriptional regulator [Chloroflexi bacterium]|nr:WYL domain-containing transcriptional regulator [Chloroflexota bacterium]